MMAHCNTLLAALLAVVLFSGSLCLAENESSTLDSKVSVSNSSEVNTTTTTVITTEPTNGTDPTAHPTANDPPSTTNDPPSTTVTNTTTNATTVAPTTAKPTGTPTYEVKGKDNKYCMVLQANIVVSFNTTANQSVTSDVPHSAQVTGSCGKLQELMTLQWTVALDNTTNSDVSMTLTVSKPSDSTYQLSHVSVKLAEDNETFSANTSSFKTSMKSYYKCDANQSISAKDLRVDFTNLKLAAFSTQTKSDFDGLTALDCKSNTTDAIVPIAVGCALAVMVLIVLIGYCIGRRRTRPGYQQMSE